MRARYTPECTLSPRSRALVQPNEPPRRVCCRRRPNRVESNRVSVTAPPPRLRSRGVGRARFATSRKSANFSLPPPHRHLETQRDATTTRRNATERNGAAERLPHYTLSRSLPWRASRSLVRSLPHPRTPPTHSALLATTRLSLSRREYQTLPSHFPRFALSIRCVLPRVSPRKERTTLSFPLAFLLHTSYFSSSFDTCTKPVNLSLLRPFYFGPSPSVTLDKGHLLSCPFVLTLSRFEETASPAPVTPSYRGLLFSNAPSLLPPLFPRKNFERVSLLLKVNAVQTFPTTRQSRKIH